MTNKPKRLDRSRPPPGWRTTTATPDFPLPDDYRVSYDPPHDTHGSLSNAGAWRDYDRTSQPARDDERARIVEWLARRALDYEDSIPRRQALELAANNIEDRKDKES